MLRCRPHRIGVSLLFAFLCVYPTLWSAEEAWREGGEKLRGILTLDGEKLRFQPSEGAVISSENLTRIRFTRGNPAPFRVGAGRRVRLWDGQQITGQILDLDKDKLRLRTAWTPRLEIPRTEIASIEALPGWQTVMHNDVKAFALKGDPKWLDPDDGSSARALELRMAGQELAYTLPEPIEAGRFGVNFREQEAGRAGQWTVDLLFQQGERVRHVTVDLTGNGQPYSVAAAGLKGTSRKVTQTPGWHRLIVQFSKRSLRLTCDDEVLWYTLDEGVGGTLRRTSIHCRHEGGATLWAEFCLDRSVNEHPKPPPDPEQDEVRSFDDDQIFGRILHADSRTLKIEGRFGKRSLPWTTVSNCSFHRPIASPKEKKTGSVRLYIDSGLDAEPDVLEGVVTALDGRRIVLRHTQLGEFSLGRDRVRELRPLPSEVK
jgi:hypothetical protein